MTNPPDYDRRFRRTRARQLVAQIICWGGLLVVIVTLQQNLMLSSILILALVLPYTLFTVLNWRCPRCRHAFTHSLATSLSKCPQCGAGMNRGGSDQASQ